jgi:hypothetical protein
MPCLGESGERERERKGDASSTLLIARAFRPGIKAINLQIFFFCFPALRPESKKRKFFKWLP